MFLRVLLVSSALLLGSALPAFAGVLPAHGTVLSVQKNGEAIIRTDAVTNTLPPATRRYRIEPAISVPPGTGVDGFIDRSTTPWRWHHAAIAGAFAPGLPDKGKSEPIDIGSQLPHTTLVDQHGRLVDLAGDFHGKVQLISFVFTRCPDRDECPTVSSKFSYLQQHLDPNKFHLEIVTLDPPYDSPAVLKAYGAQFGADARAWSLLTGQSAQIQHLLNRFGISSLRVSDEKFIHSDKVFVADENGKVADVIQTIGFSPDSLIAEARHIAGLRSSPLGRLELSLIASVVALCGGSQFAGIVLLETVLFLIITLVAFLLLGWVARQLWKNA